MCEDALDSFELSEPGVKLGKTYSVHDDESQTSVWLVPSSKKAASSELSRTNFRERHTHTPARGLI